MNSYKINFSRSNSFIVFSDKDTTMNNTLLERIKLGGNILNNHDKVVYNTHGNVKSVRQDKQYR
jgi:hypothetical protein